MQAIEIIPDTSGNRLQLNEFPQPAPRADQVLIQVSAAGVNRPDLLQRQGIYPPPPGASPLLGLEVAGTIVEVGEAVTTLQPGDRVCALLSGGGYADHALASAQCCLPLPPGYSFIQGAALPETFFTVWSNLFARDQITVGQSLLVHGGTSGIGITALQMAKALGNRVYVTAGSQEKCQRCLELGANGAINYRTEDFVEVILAQTQNKGVDVILDMVGGDYFPRNLKCLASDGQLIQIAIQQGAKSEINLWSLMSNRLHITGSTLRSRSDEFKGQIARQLHERIWPLLARGEIAPVIDSVFALRDAELAHKRMLSSLHIGKIILEI